MLKELFTAIESPRFSAEMNVVSGFGSFMRALSSHPQVRQLGEALDSPKALGDLFNRLLEVMGREFDTRYENPWDVALATYLLLLSTRSTTLTLLAAAKIKECPQGWWARKLADRVGPSPPVPSDAGVTREIITGQEPLVATTIDTVESGFSVLGIRPQPGSMQVYGIEGWPKEPSIVDASIAKKADYFTNVTTYIAPVGRILENVR
jgi:hypothetical protein